MERRSRNTLIIIIIINIIIIIMALSITAPSPICHNRYIYTGQADLDSNNVLFVLYTANKYDISGLARACVSYVEEQLDVQNACTLMEQAHLFNEQGFRSRVLELILRRGEEVLQCEDVGELCHDCLVDVVKADNLICKEEQVFDALDR